MAWFQGSPKRKTNHFVGPPIVKPVEACISRDLGAIGAFMLQGPVSPTQRLAFAHKVLCSPRNHGPVFFEAGVPPFLSCKRELKRTTTVWVSPLKTPPTYSTGCSPPSDILFTHRSFEKPATFPPGPWFLALWMDEIHFAPPTT